MSLNICTLTEIGVSLVWPTYSQSRLYVHMKYKEFDVTSLDLSGIYSPTNMSIHVRFHEKRRQLCVFCWSMAGSRTNNTTSNSRDFVHCLHLTTELTAGRRAEHRVEPKAYTLALLDHKTSLTLCHQLM